MVMRDTIYQIINQEYESDGEGGRVSLPGASNKPIKCRASFDTSPEVAAAYGLQSEQILYTFTSVALDEEALYLFNGKKYSVRHVSPSNRLFYSILIEEKR